MHVLLHMLVESSNSHSLSDHEVLDIHTGLQIWLAQLLGHTLTFPNGVPSSSLCIYAVLRLCREAVQLAAQAAEGKGGGVGHLP